MNPARISGTITEPRPAGVSAPERVTPTVAPSSSSLTKSWQASRRRAAL